VCFAELCIRIHWNCRADAGFLLFFGCGSGYSRVQDLCQIRIFWGRIWVCVPFIRSLYIKTGSDTEIIKIYECKIICSFTSVRLDGATKKEYYYWRALVFHIQIRVFYERSDPNPHCVWSLRYPFLLINSNQTGNPPLCQCWGSGTGSANKSTNQQQLWSKKFN